MANIAKKVKLENGVQFCFEDKAATKIDVVLDGFSDAIVKQLAIHGLSQKVGDSYSGAENIKDAIENVKQTVKNLLAGNFNARSSGGSLFIEALARIKGITTAKVEELLEVMDEDEVAELKKKPKVKSTITVIKGEREIARLKGMSDDADDINLG